METIAIIAGLGAIGYGLQKAGLVDFSQPFNRQADSGEIYDFSVDSYDPQPVGLKAGYLSKNFTIAEFQYSNTAKARGIDNTMPADAIARARLLCEHVLQPARDYFGKPILITSGYRSPALNAAIGGASNSQHLTGEAADIELAGGDNWELLRFINDHLNFDQLIAENMAKGSHNAGWIHVSYRNSYNRHARLTIQNGTTRQGIALT